MSHRSVMLRTGLAALILVVALASRLAGGLPSEFVYDDREIIAENPWLRSPRHIPSMFASNFWAFYPGGELSRHYRPLQHLMNMLFYQVAGPSPSAFRLMYYAFYSLSAVLVFMVALGLMRDRPPWAAFTSALLFALHPVNTGTSAQGITEMTFACLMLLGLWLHMRGRPIAAAPVFLLSLLCKETAVVLLPVIVAHDYATGMLRPLEIRRLAVRYSPYAAAAIVYAGMRANALTGLDVPGWHQDLTPVQCLINTFPLIGAYAWKLIWPHPLSAFYGFKPVEDIWTAGVLVPMALVPITLWVAYRARARAEVLVPMALLVLPLIPALYIPALGVDVFVERYLYVPSMGFAILAAHGAWWVAARGRGLKALVAATLVAVTMLYATATVRRMPVWEGNLALWSDTAARSRDQYIPRAKFGLALKEAGLLDEALVEFKAAVGIAPEDAGGHSNLGGLYMRMGLHDLAVEAYKNADRLEPSWQVKYNLGLALEKTGDQASAIEALRAALALKPDLAQAHAALGRILYGLGHIEDAIAALDKALTLDPSYPPARQNLTLICGQPAGAPALLSPPYARICQDLAGPGR